jgi:trehalose/maltose hydrolase-like predicted phosphorylase
MLICFHDGVISQFEGFDELEELDWAGYRQRYGSIDRLDRILEAENDSTDRYKLTKQADLLMVFYLLGLDEVTALLDRLGYESDHDLLARNVAYYEGRTVHGSTLSRVVHAWVTARLDRPRSWELFCRALRSDVDDIQGGTTAEGIHLGAMAGTVDLLQRCYTGIEARLDELRFDPAIPARLGSLAFDVRYRGHLVHLMFTPEQVRIRVDGAEGQPITIAVRGDRRLVSPGETVEFSLGGADR